jgi:hypothetical protein
MTTHKHETRKLSDLTIHPLLKDSPMLPPDHPDMRNLRRGMEDGGLDHHPVVINDKNQIMDGRHRAMIAGLMGYEMVPVEVRPESEAEEVIVNSLMCRRHMYKWQLAYTLAPIIERYVEKGKQKRMLNLKNAKNTNVSSKGRFFPFEAMDPFLTETGIAIDAWKRVKILLDKFSKRPDLRAQYEPRMFLPDSDPQAISLEGVMKAIGAVESYETNKHDVKTLRGEHDRLALDLMKKAAAQLEFFDKLEPAKQKKLAEDTVQAVRLWPMELKKEILAALQQDFNNEQKHRKIK